MRNNEKCFDERKDVQRSKKPKDILKLIDYGTIQNQERIFEHLNLVEDIGFYMSYMLLKKNLFFLLLLVLR